MLNTNQKKMEKARSIKSEIVVNATLEKVWEILYTRFGETFLFNPNLEGSHFSRGTTGEVDCERECNLDAKTFIRERIVDAEPLKKFTVEVVGGNMPMLKTLRVDFLLGPVSGQQTTVSMDALFTTKPAFMGAIMQGPFTKRLSDMLIGLKYHLETGKTVSKKSYRAIARQYRELALHGSFA